MQMPKQQQQGVDKGKLMREVKGCGTVDFRDSLLKSSHFTCDLKILNQTVILSFRVGVTQLLARKLN